MQNVAQELSETIGEFRSRKDDGRLSALAVVVAVFLVSAMAAAVPNHEGNAGAKVAEAASRFDRQVDDTRAACTDIRELIPEQKNLAAVSPESYANESTSGNNSEFKYASPNASPNDSSNVALPSGVRCGAKVGASAVENRGHEHVHPVRQEPVRVRGDNGVDDLDVPLQAGLLLESLDAFEAEIAGLAEAMKSS